MQQNCHLLILQDTTSMPGWLITRFIVSTEQSSSLSAFTDTSFNRIIQGIINLQILMDALWAWWKKITMALQGYIGFYLYAYEVDLWWYIFPSLCKKLCYWIWRTCDYGPNVGWTNIRALMWEWEDVNF